MNTNDWITLAASMAALLTAIYTIWRGRKTMPVEMDKIRADTAKTYQNIARDAGERQQQMNERCDELEQRMDTVEHNFRIAMSYIQDLLTGIDRLVHQIKAAGQTPVWVPPSMPKLKDTGELKPKP